MGQAMDTVQRFYSAYAAGELAAAMECWYPDGHTGDPGIGTVGIEPWCAYGEGFKRAMPAAATAAA